MEHPTAKQQALDVAPTLTFFVPGDPQGRIHTMGAITKDGRPFSRPTGSKASREDKASWRAMVREYARRAMEEQGWRRMDRGAVELSVTFILRPPSNYRWKTPHQAPRCWRGVDRTNLLRAFEDALSGLLWWDDRQVSEGPPVKRYARPRENPGAQVTVRALGEWSDEIWPGR